jgi:FtsP/CotA-like multicopper oxidase with cupredoxin domain
MALTRRQALVGLAAVSVARPSFGAVPELVAAPAAVQLAPEGYDPTPVWAFGGQVPGPVLRASQGDRMRQRVVNRLDVPTSVHWHGIRLENAMDGVAGLTQDAIAPGESFDYDFRLPDAGTFWYHAHNRSFEQVARGLLGPLIIEEAEPPQVDDDIVLMLDDWRFAPDATLAGDFGALFDAAHGGRIGNWVTVNGVGDWRKPLPRGARVRLRLINGANARVFRLGLQGMTATLVALDGMPLTAPRSARDLVLAPAQRADLIVDIDAAEGGEALIVSRERDGDFALAGFPVTAGTSPRPEPVRPLPPNPVAMPAADTPVRDLRMEGGAMGGMRSARAGGQSLDPRTLAERGLVWSLAGMAGMPDAPFAEVTRGDTVRIRLVNDTAWPHGMHLHGHHFVETATGHLRDTTLVAPNASADIAFVADNPGDWLLHCHMLEHAAAGMMTWIRVT